MPRKRQPLPSVSEVVEQIRSRVAEVPNHRLVCARVLGESERTLKTAAVVEILDEQSQSPHRELHLSDYGIGVLGAVQWEAKRRLGRWSCAGAEIDQLRALLGDELLQTAPPLDAPVPTEACAAVARVHALGLGALVSVLARRSEELAALPGRASTDGRRIVAAAPARRCGALRWPPCGNSSTEAQRQGNCCPFSHAIPGFSAADTWERLR